MRLLSKIGVAAAAVCALTVFMPATAQATVITVGNSATFSYAGPDCFNCSATANFDLTSATALVITINNTSGNPPNNYLTQLLTNSDPDINITAATFKIDNVATTAWNFETARVSGASNSRQTASTTGPLLAVRLWWRR